MEAPAKGRSREDFATAVSRHVVQMYEEIEKGYRCKACGAEIKQTTCSVSVHPTKPGEPCEDVGDVEQYGIPYCPNCEGLPTNTKTCVHISAR